MVYDVTGCFLIGRKYPAAGEIRMFGLWYQVFLVFGAAFSLSGCVLAVVGAWRIGQLPDRRFLPDRMETGSGSQRTRKAEDVAGHSERPYLNQNGSKFNLFAVTVYFYWENRKGV